MAAEVSSLMRLLTRQNKDDDGGGGGGRGNRAGGDLVTRDLLGGCCGGSGVAAPTPVGDRKELELRLSSTPAGENRLGVADLNMPPLCSSGIPLPPRPTAPHLHDLPRERPTAALDLMLRPLALPLPADYQSVCTLEKVKSALERAQRESSLRRQQPAAVPGPASPSSSSTTTASAKRLREAARDEEGERESKSASSSSSSSSVVLQSAEDRGAAAGMAAAGCPSCLLYVLISRSDPRCPRCNSAVPLPPPPSKRPRINLNEAVATSSAGTEPAPAATPLRTVNFF